MTVPFSAAEEDRSSLLSGRDPFGLPMKTPCEVAQDVSTKMFLLKGLMLAAKPGVVLEEQPGGNTVFLSEGESGPDVLVKKVNADGAVLVVNGQEVVLQSPSRMQ